MRSDHCAHCAPTTAVTIGVHYCHDHRRWLGEVCVDSLTVGGPTIRHATVSHEFGPFDSYIEVGHWLSGQQRALKGICTDEMMRMLCDVPADDIRLT